MSSSEVEESYCDGVEHLFACGNDFRRVGVSVVYVQALAVHRDINVYPWFFVWDIL